MAWPVQHETNSLAVNRAYLKKAVSRILFPDQPNVKVWSNDQEQEANLAIDTGLRNFYNPVQVLGRASVHEWSFLAPTETMVTVANQITVDMPPGFAMLDGPMFYRPSTTAMGPAVQEVSEQHILGQLAQVERTGQPTEVACRVKSPDAQGTRYELLFWPIPDDAYEISFKYRASPALLQADEDYPLGGAIHAQTIIEACMAAAEELRGVKGLHGKLFRERLAASVARDQQAASPETLGYGYDRSDRPMDPYGLTFHDCSYNTVTYNHQIVE